MNDISEDELAKITKQFSILEAFPGPVSIKTHDFRLVYANKFLKEFLPEEDWLQKTPFDLYPPEFAQGVVDSDKRTCEEGSRAYEQTAIDKNGQDRHFKSYKFLIKRENGQPLICAISVDTTELVRVREAISESEVKFRGAFEDAATGMALISLDGALLKVNSSLCEMLGYSEDDLLSKGLEAVSHPDEFVPVLANPQLFIDDGVSSFRFEKRYIHKEGHVITAFVNSAIAVDDDNKAKYYVTQIQDISDSKQLEEELRESERRYRSLFEQNNDAVFILS
ncbi:MAG: PAS domain-containing protein, partial [Candidatus Thorarchaeota archaeon]